MSNENLKKNENTDQNPLIFEADEDANTDISTKTSPCCIILKTFKKFQFFVEFFKETLILDSLS